MMTTGITTTGITTYFEGDVNDFMAKTGMARGQAKKFFKELEKGNKLQKKKIKQQVQENKGQKDTVKGTINLYKTLLPVLFASQEMVNTTQGLLAPSMDLLGVQKTWDAFMGVAFLPTAEKQLDNVFALGDALLSQSDAEREASGDLILHAQVVAQATAAGAQWGTMLGGLGGDILGVGTAAVGFGAGLGLTNNKMAETIVSMSGFNGGITLMAATVLSKTDEITGETGMQKILNKMMGINETPVTVEITEKGSEVVIGVLDEIGKKVLNDKNFSIIANIKTMFGDIDLSKILSSVTTGPLLKWWKGLSFQSGGIMPYDGLAYLHKGETITPSGGGYTGGNITVNANLSSSMDVKNLATQLNQYMYDEYRRLR